MRFFHFLIPLLFCFSANAQDLQLVSAVGDNLTGATTTLSFSIGEVVIETFSNSQSILNQGFFQHFDFVSARNEEKFDELVFVYPNPFQEQFHILVKEEPFAGRLEIILTNLLGQILHESTIDASALNNHTLNTLGWSSGIYLLTIISDQKTVKSSYKLIKQP